MKSSSLLCFLLFLGAVALGLLQLWFKLWAPDTFFKLLVTDIAALVICFVWGFLVRENKESKKIGGGNSLD